MDVITDTKVTTQQTGRSTKSKRRYLTVLAVVAGGAVALAATSVVVFVTRGGASSPTPAKATGPAAAAQGAQVPGQPDASGAAKLGGSPSAAASGAPGRSYPATYGNWPGSNNTGVPAGVALTAYGGPCTITAAGTVIDSKTVNCDLTIRANNVTIRKSKVNGQVFNDQNSAYSVTVVDSEVDAGKEFNAAVSNTNVTVLRSNIHGGETSVNCAHNCSVRDSWLHGQYIPPGGDWHLDAFLSNGADHATLTHNTLACDSPSDGCSGAIGLFGDFKPNSYITVDSNLIVANDHAAYCVYGGSQDNKNYEADHIVYVNNVFQRGRNGKCGYYGWATAFSAGRPGNLWQNNKWEDGTPVVPQ